MIPFASQVNILSIIRRWPEIDTGECAAEKSPGRGLEKWDPLDLGGGEPPAFVCASEAGGPIPGARSAQGVPVNFWRFFLCARGDPCYTPSWGGDPFRGMDDFSNSGNAPVIAREGNPYNLDNYHPNRPGSRWMHNGIRALMIAAADVERYLAEGWKFGQNRVWYASSRRPRRRRKPGEPYAHGSCGAYREGCRCAECRKYESERKRMWRIVSGRH